MSRVKRGVTARPRHKKLLVETRGYRHGRKKIYRLAHQAFLKAGTYRYRDRRVRKRTFRRLWVVKLNTAARSRGLSYAQLIFGVQQAKLPFNRRVLAELAEHHPLEFEKVVEKVKTALKTT